MTIIIGNFWKNLDSIIVSHVADEGSLFVPGPIDSDYASTFLHGLFSDYAPKTVQKLTELYTDSSSNATLLKSARDMTRDGLFTCNTRRLVKAYDRRSYLMQYSVSPGTHGADVGAIFYSPDFFNATIPLFAAYQSYLASYALTGDPNELREKGTKPPTIHWPQVHNVNSEKIHNTLNVTETGFELIKDEQNLKSVCDLWDKALLSVTAGGGD